MQRDWRSLSLYQPWATMCGMTHKGIRIKGNETRSWHTSYRGWLMIHATKLNQAKSPFQTISLFGSITPQSRLIDVVSNAHTFPLGAIVVVARVEDCLEMVARPGDKGTRRGVKTIAISEVDPEERKTGDWKPGRFAWKLTDSQLLEQPVPAIGSPGLWIPKPELVQAVEAQLQVPA